ncbi:MAG: tyrosine-type recombinase/integrase [Alteromonadaceae bacterium]|nr:tyrosine-type recombinase/integrase [Alteromonadaceae bacterium]
MGDITASFQTRPSRVEHWIGLLSHIKGKSFSSHSFRVDGALNLLECGKPIKKIMLKGGWKATSTVTLYLRAWVDI